VKPITIDRRARAELEKAMAWYDKQRQGLGLELQTEVEKAVAKVQENRSLARRTRTPNIAIGSSADSRLSLIMSNWMSPFGLPPLRTAAVGPIIGVGVARSNNGLYHETIFHALPLDVAQGTELTQFIWS
jgi:hypothetical protein